jgi:hypothetical protein
MAQDSLRKCFVIFADAIVGVSRFEALDFRHHSYLCQAMGRVFHASAPARAPWANKQRYSPHVSSGLMVACIKQ